MRLIRSSVLALAVLASATLALAGIDRSAPRTASTRIAVERALASLPGADWHTWLATVRHTQQAGADAVPVLLGALADPHRSIRTAAAHSLAGMTGIESTECRAAVAATLLESANDPLDQRSARHQRIVEQLREDPSSCRIALAADRAPR